MELISPRALALATHTLKVADNRPDLENPKQSAFCGQQRYPLDGSERQNVEPLLSLAVSVRSPPCCRAISREM
jgi:hypothetical protein